MDTKNYVTQEQFAALKKELGEIRAERVHKRTYPMKLRRRLRTVTLLCIIGIPMLYAAVPNSFTAGSAAVAADVNANFTHLDEVSVPVGGIIGWHKSLAGVPALPASGKWVECNGQVLADAGSPLNGQTIPNLNGAAAGANSPGQSAKIAMFLRGGIASGSGQTDLLQGHEHYLSDDGGGSFVGRSGGSVSGDFTTTPAFDGSASRRRYQTGGGYLSDGSNGTPRVGSETRPVNMAVVWIMRVK